MLALYMSPWGIASGQTDREELEKVRPSIDAYLDHYLALAAESGWDVADARAQSEAWEKHKAGERASKGIAADSALAGVPVSLPALVRAQKIQRRAAREGFDWPRIEDVVDKLDEELSEFKDALRAQESGARLQEELGDLLFSCVNLARFLDADAESLVRDANHKFEARFRSVEALARQRRRALRKTAVGRHGVNLPDVFSVPRGNEQALAIGKHQLVGGQRLVDDAAECIHGHLEHLVTLHLYIGMPGLDMLVTGRYTVRHRQQVLIAAVGVQVRRKNARLVAGLEDNRASAIAEQDTGAAVVPVDNT